MAEAIISRRGNGGGLTPSVLVTSTIVQDTSWTVPNHTGNVSVLIFGGGGGGVNNNCGGGGGGWMNNRTLSLSNQQTIQITIGSGGSAGQAGGTTSFGTYLSANGGEQASGSWLTYRNWVWKGGNGGSGGGGWMGGTGYQFGGGGGAYWAGGDGGTWGGGGGGGGMGPIIYLNNFAGTSNGGNGGTYGGGGGGGSHGTYINNSSNYNSWYFGVGGKGGTYGGNGGNCQQSGTNGTNTMSNSSVLANCRGNGKAGTGSYLTGGGGGGGFGGRGGNGASMSGGRWRWLWRKRC